MLIGYARVSTNAQDLTAQRNALTALGVDDENIHVDHGLTAPTANGPGSGRPYRPCVRATHSLSRSSTGSPDRCPTRVTSRTS